jgi:hypothetical protein
MNTAAQKSAAYQEGYRTGTEACTESGYVNTDNPYCMEDPRFLQWAEGFMAAGEDAFESGAA